MKQKIRNFFKGIFVRLIGQHLGIFSCLIFSVGLVYFFCWPSPFLERNTYFSENALSVGSALTHYQSNLAEIAIDFSDDFCSRKNRYEFLIQSLKDIGLDVHISNSTQSPLIYSVLRAPKGNGKESIVVSTPIDKCDSLGLSISILKLLSREKWLHHDILFIIYEDEDKVTIDSLKEFGGQIRECINIDIDNFQIPSNQMTVAVLTHGFNGDLPNLDLVNTVVRSVETQGMRASLHKEPLRPYKKPWNKYMYMFKFMLSQILSVPTGIHGLFRSGHTIHSITMANIKSQEKQVSSSYFRRHNINSIGRAIEITIRSMNNLIEQLHQSFFLYFMISENTFIGYEDYHGNLWIFVAAFLIPFFGYHYVSIPYGAVKGSKTIIPSMIEKKKQHVQYILQSIMAIFVSCIFSIISWLLPTLLTLITQNSFTPKIYLMSYFLVELLMYLVIELPLMLWIVKVPPAFTHKFYYWQIYFGFILCYISIGLCILTVYHSALMLILAIYLFALKLIVSFVISSHLMIKIFQSLLLTLISPITLAIFILFSSAHLSNSHMNFTDLYTNITQNHEDIALLIWNQMNTSHSINALFLSLVMLVVPAWKNMVASVLSRRK